MSSSPSMSPLRGPSRWHGVWARLHGLPLLSALLGLCLLAKYQTCKEVPPSCEEASRQDHPLTVLICKDELAERGAPRTGAILADELRRSNDLPAAKQLASQLLETPARADALSVLGKIAGAENELDRAEQALSAAAELHTARSEWRAATTDLLALARVLDERQKYPEAIEARSRGSHLARMAGDRALESDFHISAARSLLDLGNHAGARAELQRARTPGPVQRLDVLLAEANLKQATHGHRQAANLYAELHGSGRLSPRQALTVNAELAYSFVELRELELASEHLAIARSLDTKGVLPSSLASIEALLEWRGGKDLARADALLRDAIATLDEGELNDKTDYLIDRAELALERGDLGAARAHAQEAVGCVEEIRTRLQARYRTSITERYRRSYELLFLALARAGQAPQALAVLEEWQARDHLDALTPTAAPRACDDLQCAADDARSLNQQRDALRASAFFRSYSAAELGSLMRGNDLVAIALVQLGPRDPVTARKDELWRLVARGETIELTRLGRYADLESRLQQLIKDPFDARAASAMGALLIPADLFAPTDRILHVLLDSKLGALPLPALQRGGKPLIAVRPVLRVLRPSDVACVAPLPAAPRVTVLGDAAADLPGAAKEAWDVATRFGVTGQIQTKATLAALRAPTELLHVAVHGDIDPELGDGVLRMHDGDEHAIEIATRGGAPALVVLASCLSAVSEGNYSLATAYLAAGARQVVASTRPISDGGTASVAEIFYARGGTRDPVRGLARAQAELAAGKTDRTWPLFAVYGRPTCKAGQGSNR